VFYESKQQLLVGTITLLFVAPALRWNKGWAIALAINRIALWLLPNAAAVWTGI
jgi:hypothetical protein